MLFMTCVCVICCHALDLTLAFLKKQLVKSGRETQGLGKVHPCMEVQREKTCLIHSQGSLDKGVMLLLKLLVHMLHQ